MKAKEEKITKNLYRFYTHIAELCGYETGSMAGCNYVWNKSGSWPAYNLGLPYSDQIPDISKVLSEKKIPPFWIVQDSDQKVIRMLEEIGIRAVRQWTGMILNPVNFRPATPNKAITLRTGQEEILPDWLDIVNTEIVTGAQMGVEITGAISSSRAFQFLVAYLDGQPVGTGLTFEEDGVCGIYLIATRKEFRGRGVGTLVVSELIRRAFQSGNHSAILHSTGMGQSIYIKSGFEVVNHYSVLWSLGQ